MILYIAALVIVSAGLGALAAALRRRARRSRLKTTPPPPAWLQILERNFPIVDQLSPDQRQRLFGAMHVFLAEKKLEGCGGLELTEEINVTVAAQACLLLAGRDTGVYPKLKTVLIYPHTYTGARKGFFGGDNGASARLGESWDCGVVVLAWDSVLGGARNLEDGHNVTLHEFAHQLDQEDGAADGAPVLEERSAYLDWARIFQQEYKQLVDQTNRGRISTMDRYGATNPAEFFAVATETFFEKPRQLSKKHPELYEELKEYYHLDPLAWAPAQQAD